MELKYGFYEDIKDEKEMLAQVLSKDLPNGDRDGGDDPPPLNIENVHFGDILCYYRCRIVSSNKSPWCFSLALPYHNPGTPDAS